MTERAEDLCSAARPGLLAIFAAFFRLGVTSFGGNTAAWVYGRHWVSDAEFLSAVALGRIVPGSGGVNLTVQIGQRLAGAAGAAAAVLALLMGPLVIVVGLAMVYARIGRNPVLEGTLDGVSAAAIGLTFATGLRLVVWAPQISGRSRSPWSPCSASACCADRWCPSSSAWYRSASVWRSCSVPATGTVAIPDDLQTLLTLAVVFVPLSLLSIGGGALLLADMEHQSVAVQGWTTPGEFADLFAISRAAPGPGTMLSALIGWRAAGWAGAITATVALYLPSSLLACGAARLWGRWCGSAWHSAIERAAWRRSPPG